LYTCIVFDVEPPNRADDRMSAIGITVIGGGKMGDEFFSLVDPETHFAYRANKNAGKSEFWAISLALLQPRISTH
jgi:DNA polymerase-3 subunit epsilon